jgi:protein-S-isoprenylcysteine O-methyltransferase Ste14
MEKEIRESAPASIAVKATAVVCYLLAAVGLLAFCGLFGLLGLDLVQLPPEPALPVFWVVDIGLVALFALQHSGMARRGFKQVWRQEVGLELERPLYVGASGAAILAVSIFWQPLGGGDLWRLPWQVAGLAVAAAVASNLCALCCNPLGEWSIRRLWGLAEPPEQLRIVGPYRWVRHPQMSCMLVFLWAWPVMSPTLAVLSGGMTLYILASRPLEERDLAARFGAVYAEYRRGVPAYIPWRPPVARAIVDEAPP